MEFDEFVEAHLSALGRYAGVLTGDRHLAEDVLSDALITASSRWDLIGQMEYPLAYVRRIVASLQARPRSAPPTAHHCAQAEPAGSLVSPGDPHARLDDRDELDRLLRGLTPTQRGAVVMRFYLDLPDTDIAQALGCSPGTVRSTISRALSALRLTLTCRKGLIGDGPGTASGRTA